MSKWNEIQFGIRRPETARKTIEQSTLEGMRAAIYKASFDSVLIRQCTIQADMKGMSGEDRYTLLAYQALRSLEEYAQKALEMSRLYPNPPMIMGDIPGDGRSLP